MIIRKNNIDRIKRCSIYNDRVNIYQLPVLSSYHHMEGYKIKNCQILENTNYCEIEVDTTFVSRNHYFMLSPIFIIYIPCTHLLVYGEYLFYNGNNLEKSYVKNLEREEYIKYYRLMYQIAKHTCNILNEKNIREIIFQYIYGSYLNGE